MLSSWSLRLCGDKPPAYPNESCSLFGGGLQMKVGALNGGMFVGARLDWCRRVAGKDLRPASGAHSKPHRVVKKNGHVGRGVIELRAKAFEQIHTLSYASCRDSLRTLGGRVERGTRAQAV